MFPEGVHLFEDLHTLRIGCYSYENVNADDDFLPLVQRLLPHGTWIIATPLYWYSMSAQAKTFLDRLTDLITVHKEQGRLLRGKRLAVLCSGTDPRPPDSFSEPFRLTCAYLGMAFVGTHYTPFNRLQPAHTTARHDAQSFARAVASGDDFQNTSAGD